MHEKKKLDKNKSSEVGVIICPRCPVPQQQSLGLAKAAAGSQCSEKRKGAAWKELVMLNSRRAAAFWISCRGLVADRSAL